MYNLSCEFNYNILNQIIHKDEELQLTTQRYLAILPCHNDTAQCYHPFAQILDGVNCLSIIFNILHLVILNQMKEIKTTKYFWILVNFSISDLVFSFSSIVYFTCEVRQAILQLHIPAAYWISKIIFAAMGCGIVLRYFVLLLSSIEKYIGVCQPYKYSTHFFINHFFINNFKCVAGLTYSFGLLIPIALSMIPEIKFCWTSLTIQITPQTREHKVVYALFATQNLILSLLISVVLVKVWKELKLMIQRSSSEDKLIISASKYVIWSYLVYQLNFLFVLVFLVCQTFNSLSTFTIAVEAPSAIFLSMYGIANIFMFIYFHPKYICQVKSMLQLGSHSHRVIRPRECN